LTHTGFCQSVAGTDWQSLTRDGALFWAALLPADDMQVQTYLRMSGLPVGLLFNFHALRRKDGLRRSVESPNSLLRGAQWSSFCLRVKKSLA
jgi:hypothetical protein